MMVTLFFVPHRSKHVLYRPQQATSSCPATRSKPSRRINGLRRRDRYVQAYEKVLKYWELAQAIRLSFYPCY
ncbi:hypothetical protein PAXRUDRAFT_833750 [Paxillus rubicundulus Ve08.2h10]|uniref:Uncharacterized protein n=1 Tax=Paxillus rubicundulus Ve08.2h10 TaxID=930991 RepID=A0A0D0CB38_9AGAM|nr:hypothetical protein PAXRUDRAFT_833750 [Paxillus rubicundulus Ve08.2h10]